MKSIIKTLSLCLIFIALVSSQFVYGEGNRLTPRVYNLEDADDLFKRANDTEIVDRDIYIIDNLHHTIFMYRLDKKLQFQKKIGRPGQGPGDLTLPVELSLIQGDIAVKDNIGFSFFKRDGSFISRFRTFTPWVSFVCLGDKIYNISINPRKSHLIDVYSRDGEIVKKIGKKSLPIDFEASKALPIHHVEKIFYAGKLLTDGQYLYYVNKNFGTLVKYDADGTKIAERNLVSLLDDDRKAIAKKNVERLKNGLKPVKFQGGEGIPLYHLFHDLYLFKGNVYLFGSVAFNPQKGAGKNKTPGDYDILILDLNSFSITGKYLLSLNDACEIYSCAVKEVNDCPVVVIAMSNEDGNVLIEAELTARQ